MRVLHLTTEFPPVIYGGLGTAVGGWVTASARSGLTVGVLLVEGVLAEEPDGATAYGHPQPARRAEGDVTNRDGVTFFQTSAEEAVQAGIAAARQWRPDIIHLHTAMIWHVAAGIREAVRTPLVYHVHSVDRAEYEIGHEPNQWLAQAQEQGEAIRAADRLIALSQSEHGLLSSYYPRERRRIRVVGNGIDDSRSARASARRERATDEPLILYSGRLVERKGIHELISAIPSVIRAEPRARFVFVGGPPSASAPELQRQWLPHDLDACHARIEFTGWLPTPRVADSYASADILVVPSRYEPFGMVVLEGMLHGLPIVAASTGGPAEILENERTGLLFPPRDSAALAGALVRLLRSATLRRRIGRAAAREVRSRWTWPKRVERMRVVYRELSPA